MTVLEPRAELVVEADPGSLDALVADCAEVSRHLAQVPSAPRRIVSIPPQAVAMVDGLGTYGD